MEKQFVHICALSVTAFDRRRNVLKRNASYRQGIYIFFPPFSPIKAITRKSENKGE